MILLLTGKSNVQECSIHRCSQGPIIQYCTKTSSCSTARKKRSILCQEMFHVLWKTTLLTGSSPTEQYRPIDQEKNWRITN